MDYRKIIRSRKLRLLLLRLMFFVPDKMMLRLQYRIQLGKKLDFKNPKRFSQKIQLYKIRYRNPLMIQCVDKYDVRKYISELGLSNILNECYGVYDSPNSIDYSSLPSKVVFKDTLGGGGNDVLIFNDFGISKIKATKKVLSGWIRKPLIREGGREWPYYSGKKHRIIVEKFIEDYDYDNLVDYKFFCFNGVVEYVFVATNREVGKNADWGIYSKDFVYMDVVRGGAIRPEIPVKKPKLFDEMIRVAELISKPFPHVRVDLYNSKDGIIFGEMTFFHASGYCFFEPDEFDFTLGDKFQI